jgi:quinolinate synthase
MEDKDVKLVEKILSLKNVIVFCEVHFMAKTAVDKMLEAGKI